MLRTGPAAPRPSCQQQSQSQQRALRSAATAAAPHAHPRGGAAGVQRPAPLAPPRGQPLAATPPLDVQVVEAALADPAVDDVETTLVATVVVDAESGGEVALAAVAGEDDAVDVAAVDGVDVASAGVVAVAAANLTPATPTPTPTESVGSARIADVDVDVVEAAAVEAMPLDRSAAAATSPHSLASEPQPHPQPREAQHQQPLRRAPEVDLPLAALAARGSTATAARRRPFPPPLDLQRLGDALLGEPTIGPIFNELFALSRNRQNSVAAAAVTAADGGAGGPADPSSAGPLLYAPRFPRPPSAPPASSLPLLVYLPGIDGTGLAAYRQFPGLAARFDLRGVFMPPEDRTPFHGLVEALAQQLEDEVAPLDPSRPVYLMGESFGGLLALELAQRLSFVDRLVLVNPATSFDRSPWPSLGPLLPALPPDVYRLLPVALSPILSNPLAMAAWNASPADLPPQQAVDLLYGLLDLLPELSSLRVVLPPETLAWRLKLLEQGAQTVNASLSKVRQRTLLLVGSNDLVIPSASEAPRLEAALPRCRARVVAGGSHALLQEASVDLAAILQEEDFYVSRRRLTRPNVPPVSPSTTSPASRRPKPAPGGANFGTAAPLELPTPGEVRRALDSGGLAILRALVSPVFLSTDAASGRVGLGLGGLPPPGPDSGPVLYVGNHQLFAPDMPLMVAHFLEERGELLRGLAHPSALGMRAQGGSDGAGPAGLRPANNRFGRFLETFGAVPVSGRNLYTLLQGGESALLYPGGVREALKLRGEQYELIWPRRAEFVRMACKLGATIVPFAAVGAEDSVELLLDRRDLMGAPLLGPWLRQQDGAMMRARRGVSESEDVEESFISPLAAPKPPARFYFLFGAPIRADPRVAGDRAAVAQLYGRVRSDVEGCLGYLLRKREQDPYRDMGPRLLYEASWGGRRQAPTFKP